MILKKFQTKEKVKLQHDYKGKFQIEIITKKPKQTRRITLECGQLILSGQHLKP